MNRRDFSLISDIADRAVTMFRHAGCPRPKPDVVMDVSAVHESIGLRLEALLGADDFNFAHDLFGIANHLDRDTLNLTDCFLPRFAQHKVAR